MILNLAKHESIGGIEGGVYYFNLQNYPKISISELKAVVAFIMYEKSYNRQTDIVCGDESIIRVVNDAVANPSSLAPFVLADETEFVYHATDLNGAKQILSCGNLLSAVNVYRKTGEELAYEKRNSPWNDPADYFEFIMFCNGDDMTGDYVVLSENFPSHEDIENGDFNAGVRLYFRSDSIQKHPGYVFDGYHPAKVKDKIILSENLFACIVPEQFKEELNTMILKELQSNVFYLSQKHISLSDWNDKVYNFVKNHCVK